MLIGVDPILLQYGLVTLTWQGLFIGIALLVGLSSAARHLAAAGLHPDLAYDAALISVPTGIIGSRLFHVADTWNYYAYHPLQIVAVAEGGYSIYGAIVFGTVASYFFARNRRLPLGRFFDATAVPQALALAIGELGDLLTGAYLGHPTTSLFAVRYINPRAFDQSHSFVYPVAAYEIMWNLAIVIVLNRLGRNASPGRSFWLFTFCFALGQLWTGFFRDLPIDFAGLGQDQLVAVLFLVISVMALTLIAVRDHPHVEPAVTPPEPS
ncbi:MAG TPA: prolipoprotein diacylglyceryl transferase family protein [Chloroflexota bacterium]|nr:prolipoprotein diacylglyceryl transferase family protein [Chloroflexota bacterium]